MHVPVYTRPGRILVLPLWWWPVGHIFSLQVGALIPCYPLSCRCLLCLTTTCTIYYVSCSDQLISSGSCTYWASCWPARGLYEYAGIMSWSWCLLGQGYHQLNEHNVTNPTSMDNSVAPWPAALPRDKRRSMPGSQLNFAYPQGLLITFFIFIKKFSFNEESSTLLTLCVFTFVVMFNFRLWLLH